MRRAGLYEYFHPLARCTCFLTGPLALQTLEVEGKQLQVPLSSLLLPHTRLSRLPKLALAGRDLHGSRNRALDIHAAAQLLTYPRTRVHARYVGVFRMPVASTLIVSLFFHLTPGGIPAGSTWELGEKRGEPDGPFPSEWLPPLGPRNLQCLVSQAANKGKLR